MIYVIISLANPKFFEKTFNRQIKVVKNVIDENEDSLRDIETKKANISSEGIEIKARAIKRGFSEESKQDEKFCKNCGKAIDSDSKFCSYCGKEQ